MSPMQNREESLSDLDLDVDTLQNSRLKGNRLPSIGRRRNKKSVVHKSVALRDHVEIPESLTKKQSPPPKTSLTPRRRKLPAKRDSSDLSDTLL